MKQAAWQEQFMVRVGMWPIELGITGLYAAREFLRAAGALHRPSEDGKHPGTQVRIQRAVQIRLTARWIPDDAAFSDGFVASRRKPECQPLRRKAKCTAPERYEPTEGFSEAHLAIDVDLNAIAPPEEEERDDPSLRSFYAEHALQKKAQRWAKYQRQTSCLR